jgi:hypothetical protein
VAVAAAAVVAIRSASTQVAVVVGAEAQVEEGVGK